MKLKLRNSETKLEKLLLRLFGVHDKALLHNKLLTELESTSVGQSLTNCYIMIILRININSLFL